MEVGTGNSLLFWIPLWGLGLRSAAREYVALLLLLYAAHYLALSELCEILLVHVVFWTGGLLLGAVRPRRDECRRGPSCGNVSTCDREQAVMKSKTAPSSEPTVLKYPAEKPPVKAPCNRRRPFSSRT